MSETNGHAATSPVALFRADEVPTSAAAIIARCDSIAVHRARAFTRALGGNDDGKSIADSLVEELDDQLAAASGRPNSKPPPPPPSRAEAIAATWWRGRDELGARFDDAGLDASERDALALLIGLELGARVACSRTHKPGDEDEDLQTPFHLVELVERGRFGPLTREKLAPTGRLARAELVTSIWRKGTHQGPPYLALRAHPRFLAELGDVSDTFGWPRPWVRVDTPVERLDDLIVPRALRAELEDVLDLARHALAGRRGGALTYGRGLCVLFHGPAGTGKTHAARAFARELGVPLASYDRTRADELGLDDDHVSKMLESWRPKDGLLFIDEVDDLLDDLRSGDSNALLLGLEAFEGVLLLATNRTLEVRDSLDRRIQRIVPFPHPDRECRMRLIRAHMPWAAHLNDAAITELARHPLSGGLIKNAALEAAAISELRDTPIDAAGLDAALRRQGRARPDSDHRALLERIRAENIDGFDVALDVLRHALDPEGAALRARLGLAEPVIDVVAPAAIAQGIVDVLASALDFSLARARKPGGRQDDDEPAEVASGPLAVVLRDGDDDFADPGALRSRANAKQAFAAFRVLRRRDDSRDDPPDVTVSLDDSRVQGLGLALIEARILDAGLPSAPGVLEALARTCCFPGGTIDVARALRVLAATVASGRPIGGAALSETSRRLGAGTRTAGLFSDKPQLRTTSSTIDQNPETSRSLDALDEISTS